MKEREDHMDYLVVILTAAMIAGYALIIRHALPKP